LESKPFPANLAAIWHVHSAMKDEKRFLRELQIKKAGNRKRRRYLKDVAAEADDFSLGRDRTDVMNEKPRQARPQG
jgi:hypothetical protein